MRICLLGTGRMARRHAGIIRSLRPGSQLAVASRDLARARAFADQLGAVATFGSYAEGIASSADLIVIATPPRGHAELIASVLAAGKHLLVEKPVTATPAELEALWPRLVAHAGVVMVAENVHFDPFHRKIRRVLAERDLGRPLLLEINRLGAQRAAGWRAEPGEMALGALHEGGCHWVRRLNDLASLYEPDGSAGVLTVSASAARLGPTPVEDTAIVCARHRSGLVSRLLHSWALPRRWAWADASRLVLERGTLYFRPSARIGVLRGHRRTLLLPPLRDRGGYRAMWRELLDCIDTGRRPALTLDHIRQDARYVAAAYASMAACSGMAA